MKTTFGAGCFWGVEAAFRKVRGVTATQVGYSGGHTKNPTYEDVCSGTTGHAEVVEVTFDPTIVSFDEILKIFWQIHDPTVEGSQYRSAIFFHTPEQEEVALQSKPPGAVTEIAPAGPFYRAEEYHQCYFEKS